MDRLIVVDSEHPDCRQDRCFEPAMEHMGFGAGLYAGLAREARRRGIEVATADVFRAMAHAPRRVACLTTEYTAETQTLLAAGARPAICHSLESPLIAYKFFHFMPRYAGRFQHNFQFRGTRQRLAGTGTTFHPLYYPADTRARLPLRPWAQRDPLVMIISNVWARRTWPASLSDLRTRLKVAARFQWWRLLDPGLRSPRLSQARLAAIEYFAHSDGFRLYGHRWDQPTAGLSAAVQQAVRRAYAGALAPGAPPKRAVLNGHRFAICFENCVFPGYVTEKIFDCFLAGCVPVYWARRTLPILSRSRRLSTSAVLARLPSWIATCMTCPTPRPSVTWTRPVISWPRPNLTASTNSAWRWRWWISWRRL